jgi:hypothetical protein
MTPPRHPETEGELLKAEAHALLAERREIFVNRGRRALLAALLDRAEATADDVRRAVELPPEVNPVCLGIVPGPLAAAGIIEADGFTKSTRPVSHARPVQVWRLADRAAALAWLTAHPDRPDPEPESEPEPAPRTERLFLFPEMNTPAGANQWA